MNNNDIVSKVPAKTDKRKLKRRKLIVKTEVNEVNKTITVEMGPNISDVDVFESIVHIINTLAERLEVEPHAVWSTLLATFNDGGMKK